MMTIADRIKERREALGMTQSQLAAKMGYKGKSSISKIESAGDKVTLKTIERAALILGCTPCSLLGWDAGAVNERVNKMVANRITESERRETVTFSVKIGTDTLKKWKAYTSTYRYGDTGKLTDQALSEYMTRHQLPPEKQKKYEALLDIENSTNYRECDEPSAETTIGKRIEKRRKELGLSQEELAHRLGNKSRASVSTVEHDKEDLTAKRIRKYAAALEMTPADLIGSGNENSCGTYDKFVRLLEMAGTNAHRVARATGLNPCVFTDWKTGKSKPKADKLKILADYFGVSIEYFLEA